ncbi:NAD-dependent epimerase/dehydratase family protein [Sphaerisporangium perillae]|uniref:NAD-dependent epimerase/dehydratase family protein n=1 Tax=Sphaerisporangium perillae TaxID=2935860 RepID=UPI00200FD9CE|nr:NAD-dependent epimerase/dehydratase family protein [Sphaerisporangium perillae]
MKVLVTGGAGFIGSNLCRALAAHPKFDRVIALDDLSSGSMDNLTETETELVIGSILDREVLTKLVAEADAVVHLAARPSVARSVAAPLDSHEINVNGTLYVLEACRSAGAHVIVASSSSVYGAASAPVKDEALPTFPLSPYGASKLAAEAYALAYAASFGVDVLAFRFFNVYGPMQPAGHAYAAVVPAFVSAALSGESLHVHGDGRQSRDFTYVGTVVNVIVDALVRRLVSPSPVNLAYGTSVTVLELAHMVGRMVDRPVAIVNEPARVGDIRHSRAGNDRLLELFPRNVPVPLEAGLERTVAWFRRTTALLAEPVRSRTEN